MPFIFYDYETSGIDKVFDQIYQFAALRTDDNLNIISEPLVLYCKPRVDVLPDPEAILVTGLSLDEISEKGLVEYEFAHKINEFFTEIPDQTICGYNSLDFDDEFTRFLFYRNLIDPYQWHWMDNNKRLDVYSLALSTFTLRPDGINWPAGTGDTEVNFKLTTLSEINNIKHEHAHDALSDVYATLEFTKLIRDKQPRLFNFFQKFNDKQNVRSILTKTSDILIHISKYYGYENCFTLPLTNLGEHPLYNDRYILFNLKCDPSKIINCDTEEIERLMYSKKEDLEEKDLERPFKIITITKNPPIYERNVLNAEGISRCKIDQKLIHSRHNFLIKNIERFQEIINSFFKISKVDDDSDSDVDGRLYGGGFFSDPDKNIMSKLNVDNLESWSQYREQLQETRLKKLVNRVLARNYPEYLTIDQKEKWNKYVNARITNNEGKFGLSINEFELKLNELLTHSNISSDDKNVLSNLERFVKENYKVKI